MVVVLPIQVPTLREHPRLLNGAIPGCALI